MLRFGKKIALLSATFAVIGFGSSAVQASTVDTVGSIFTPPSSVSTSPAYYAGTGVALGGTTFWIASDTPADLTKAVTEFTSFSPYSPATAPGEGLTAYNALAVNGPFVPYIALAYTDFGNTTVSPSGAKAAVGEVDSFTDLGTPGFTFPSAIGFTLDLTQTAPPPGGSGSDFAPISGQITFTDATPFETQGTFNVSVTFTTPTVVAGSVYNVYNANNSGTDAGLPAQDIIDVSLAPLPSAASTSLSLLVGIGGFAALRRKFSSATIA